MKKPKQVDFIFTCVFYVFLLTGCTISPPSDEASLSASSERANTFSLLEQGDAGLVAETDQMLIEPSPQERDDSMSMMTIQVGNTRYTVSLDNNAAMQALTQKLPMTLKMDELNGNEKFYYLSETLPTDSKRVGSIKAGDVMLYGSDCLVIFYKDFSTSYSYTPIGRIEDPAGLSQNLGRGSVEVTFSN
ncbi:cyclophilin-like fold protein [Trichococcus paludicola]|uniref:cyclophilin-like fold protein n=1 Tax=Trichococcus paludicola TaxID=2052942 RepID=UPI001EEF5484|nr:cyclophilin-like fold protein [Trichococcus paludicola]